MIKSNSNFANYAVIATYGQFAWFVNRDDAADFINTQPEPEIYKTVEVD